MALEVETILETDGSLRVCVFASLLEPNRVCVVLSSTLRLGGGTLSFRDETAPPFRYDLCA